jgi:hypothetical protein
MFLSETLGGGPIKLNGESFDDFAILRRFLREGSMECTPSLERALSTISEIL